MGSRLRSQKSGNWQLGGQQDCNSGLSLDTFKCRSKDQTTMMGTETSQAEDSRYVRLLKQFGEAWNAGDIDELMSMMTDDCVYCASVGPEPGTTYVGWEAVREGFLAMLAFDSGGVSRAGRVFIAGSVGVSEWSYVFRAGPDTDFEVRGCDIFEFRSDRISRKDAFRKSFSGPEEDADGRES